MTELERRRKNAKMMEEFSKVCSAFNEGLEKYVKTMKVYEFLEKQTEPKTPKEIAKALGFTWNFCDLTITNHQAVVDPLYWLLQMGLVERHPYEKTFVDTCYDGGYFKTDEKVIDGITYKANVWVEAKTREVTVECYKWSIK